MNEERKLFDRLLENSPEKKKSLIDLLQPLEKEKARLLSTEEVLERLNDPSVKKKEGRTLPPGFQWDGRDLPGRGKAAQRRLKQMAARKSTVLAECEPVVEDEER